MCIRDRDTLDDSDYEAVDDDANAYLLAQNKLWVVTGEAANFTDQITAVRPSAGTCLLYTSYGCQQNVNDGERIKGVLMDIGYGLCDKPEDADLILFNTCAVREQDVYKRQPYSLPPQDRGTRQGYRRACGSSRGRAHKARCSRYRSCRSRT